MGKYIVARAPSPFLNPVFANATCQALMRNKLLRQKMNRSYDFIDLKCEWNEARQKP